MPSKKQRTPTHIKDWKQKMGKSKGLFQKYAVERMDGKPIKEGCIVLEWSDPRAREAIAHFAKCCRRDRYTFLADDLESRLADYKGTNDD